MIKPFMSIILILFSSVLHAEELKVVPGRYAIDIDDKSEAFLPYQYSHNLSVKNPDIVRLIFSVHSLNYDAQFSFENVQRMISMSGDRKDTLVVSPQFLKGESVSSNKIKNEILYWKVSPFFGSSQARYKGKGISISCYDAIDQMLNDICSSGNFPNLQTVIVLGHSAGGQLVNRYSICGTFEFETAIPEGIEVRYIVMAPSSYAYFDNLRAIGGSNSEFAIPDNPPHGYNNWGYGLDSLYQYHRAHKITPEVMKKQYPSKSVLFLVGSEDNKTNDSTLDKNSFANLQGTSRLERARTYYNYLCYSFGETIKTNQKFSIVKGVGHNSRGLMLSTQAIIFTFSGNKKQSPVTNISK